VRRSRATIALVLALLVLALTLAACGGDNGETKTSPAPSGPQNKGATSPGAGALPPQLLECFADKGYKLESPGEIHSAPPQVVQECFGVLHQGGGSP
jgi:hypothetical protein